MQGVELADRFEAHRRRLQAIAYRILGSLTEAEDAVQEAWLRLARVDVDSVDNLGAWLTTVVSRLCLDMLRARGSRREELAGSQVADQVADLDPGDDPEQEALLAEEVGRALLVVLDRLGPAERVAFVLHDMFGLPFEEISVVVGRSSVATKKLASRARHRVRGAPAVGLADLARHRQVVTAFLTASRTGDVDAVLAVLAPGVVRRADQAAVAPGRPTEVHGARAVAEEIVVFGRNSQWAELALVNGAIGILVAPRGRLTVALAFTIDENTITGYDLIADAASLRQLNLAVLDD